MASKFAPFGEIYELVIIAIAVAILYFASEYTCVALPVLELALGICAVVARWRIIWMIVGFVSPLPTVALIELSRCLANAETFFHPSPICDSLTSYWIIISGVALIGGGLSTVAASMTHLLATSGEDRCQQRRAAGMCGNCEYDLRGAVLDRKSVV